MSYLDFINEVKENLCNTLKSANLVNLRNIKVRVLKRNIPEYLSKEECPLIAVMKTRLSGNEISTDQFDVELPRKLEFQIVIADYSEVDLDDAERYTDDLLDKVLEVLSQNPTLDNTVGGLGIIEIIFDEMRGRGIWFSIPMIRLEVVCKKIY